MINQRAGKGSGVRGISGIRRMTVSTWSEGLFCAGARTRRNLAAEPAWQRSPGDAHSALGAGPLTPSAATAGSPRGLKNACPPYENDGLHALAQTGGLPRLDAVNEVVIQRSYFQDGIAVE